MLVYIFIVRKLGSKRIYFNMRIFARRIDNSPEERFMCEGGMCCVLYIGKIGV